jgi:hypothetical protein
MDTLSDLWSEFIALEFPDRLPRHLESSVDLELLTNTAIDSIETYVLVGTLEPAADGALRACAVELARIRPQLRGDAAEYFGRLAQLVDIVMTRPNRSHYGG